MDIRVIVNTNNIYGTPKMEEGAIHEFTNYGFCEGTYGATVEFACLPAAVEDNALTIILDATHVLAGLADVVEVARIFVTVVKGLKKFLNKCLGYHKTIRFKSEGDVLDEVTIKDDVTEEELQAIIIAALEIEKMKIGKSIIEMMKKEQMKEKQTEQE